MGRHRKDKRHLPSNLYESRGYYSYRHPIEKRSYGLGTDLDQAVMQANACNLELLSNSVAIRMAEGLVKLQSKQEIVRAAKTRRDVSAIYFLVLGDEIVYVGQSANVHARIATHFYQSSKEFDGYHIIPCAPEMLLGVEATYIAAFKPRYNAHITQEAARRPLLTIQS